MKEYTLGVEVFDRGADFDPRLDPIVRVEASRLRGRLLKYYEAAGAETDLRIELPRGAYIPAFRREISREPPEPPPVPIAEPAPTPKAKRVWPLVVGTGVIAVGIALLWFGRATEPTPFTNFTRVTNEQARCTTPTLSADGRTIVYARYDEGKWDLYLRQIGSLDVRNLTSGSKGDDRQPAFSPNRQEIAFRSERDGGGIFIMELVSGAVRRIVNSGYHPAWSPDGSKIAFSTGTFADPAENSVGQPSSLRIVELASRSVRTLQVPGNVLEALQPQWSPNGARIAFWGRDDKGIRDIWTIRAEGESPAIIVSPTHDIWIDWSPTWSPDGRSLYYASDRGGSMNLWRVSIDQNSGQVSGTPEPVTTPSAYSGWPVFSRNGSRFAYVRRLFSSRLYRINFDPEHGAGKDVMQPITAGARRVREPDMSPDGTQLVVRVQDPQEDIALISPNGRDIRRLTNDSFSDRLPKWSPDGKFISFLSNRSGQFETWAINPDGSNLRQQARPDEFPSDLPSDFLPLASSPDRSRVLGRIATRSGGEDLACYTRATAETWRIPTDAPSLSAAWLGSNHRFVFSRADGFYFADLGTRRIQPIVSGLNGNLHSRFTLSRDTRTLFFALSDDQEDIWTASR